MEINERISELEGKVATLEENQRKLLHWISVLATQDWVAFTAAHGKSDPPGMNFLALQSVGGILKESADQLTEMLKREGIEIEKSNNVHT